MNNRIVLILLFIGLHFGLLYADSLDLEYYYSGMLENDVRSRRLQGAITYMNSCLPAIETDSIEVFPDTAYIDMSVMLATSYMLCNNELKADSVLSHAIEWMTQNGKSSPIYHFLYSTYGVLLLNLRNYSKASVYFHAVINFLRDIDDIGKSYVSSLASLAYCHAQMNKINIAKEEVDEACNRIDTLSVDITSSWKALMYHEIGVVYHIIGIKDCERFYIDKAYELSRNNEELVSVFIQSSISKAALFIDERQYEDALNILYPLKDAPLMEREKIMFYQNIMDACIHLNREEEATKYFDLYSRSIRDISSRLDMAFPELIVEDVNVQDKYQLLGTHCIISRFPNKKNIETVYNNILFIKNQRQNKNTLIRDYVKNDDILSKEFNEIKRLRSLLFSGEVKYREQLITIEKSFLEKLKNIEITEKVSDKEYTWEDVKKRLQPNESAIEIISFLVTTEQKSELKYGALILSKDAESPKFTTLCSFQELYDVLLNALTDQTYGINQLYKKDNDNILYNLIWRNIEQYVDESKTIYVSPILGMLKTNIGWIPCPDGKWLNEKYNIKVVTSSSKICDDSKSSELNRTVLYGGINYKKNISRSLEHGSIRDIVNEELCDSTRGGYRYLNASKDEVNSICQILQEHHCDVCLYTGDIADESSFRKLDGETADIIHLATHGFYLVGYDKYNDYFSRLFPYSTTDNSLLYSGFLLSGASTSINSSDYANPLFDGVITAEEICMMDLSRIQMVVLSACNTSVGVRLEGYGGLPYAFKVAGVKRVVGSLWEVDDKTTAKLMTRFYRNLLSGEEVHSALLDAQFEISKEQPDPYYWASFFVLE